MRRTISTSASATSRRSPTKVPSHRAYENPKAQAFGFFFSMRGSARFCLSEGTVRASLGGGAVGWSSVRVSSPHREAFRSRVAQGPPPRAMSTRASLRENDARCIDDGRERGSWVDGLLSPLGLDRRQHGFWAVVFSHPHTRAPVRSLTTCVTAPPRSNRSRTVRAGARDAGDDWRVRSAKLWMDNGNEAKGVSSVCSEPALILQN
jgi:hypothetical protein